MPFRTILSFHVTSVPISGDLLGHMVGTDDSEGLILSQSLSSSPELLTRLGQNVRSCVFAPMDMVPRLEAGYPARILFCNLLPVLCKKGTVALEFIGARNIYLRFWRKSSI
jgi:hypothetical protein